MARPDVVAQQALRKWYTRLHIPALLALNLGPEKDRRVYCYQSVEPDRSGPGGFLSLCPSFDITTLGKSAVQKVLSSEQIVPPLPAGKAVTDTSVLFALPQRPLPKRKRELGRDPREGGAHLAILEEEQRSDIGSIATFEWLEPEPPRPDLENPHEGFLDPDMETDLDDVDYQNYLDFVRGQDFWCVLEAPSESSELHYMDTVPELFIGPIPRKGLPLRQAMAVEGRQYEEILRSDTEAHERSRLGYRQLDVERAGWLVVQELEDLSEDESVAWYELKKQEAKAWWKRQGFGDTKLDFYRLMEMWGPAAVVGK
ncbi:hypothetical protein MMC11_003532 [Xylographa trunciseda]|nr:hypothetical protein [Xylographa trunciseda]